MTSVVIARKIEELQKRDVKIIRSPVTTKLPIKQFASQGSNKFKQEEISKASQRKEWSYYGENGPENWDKQFPVAASEYQSPVNIDRRLVVYDSKLKSLQFNGYTDLRGGGKLKLQNNGCNLVLKLTDEITISREDLPDTYRAFNVLFHWGSNNSKGSEHLSDGKSYPMEMQIVHRNLKYSEEEMYDKQDGLLIVSVWVDVTQDINNDGFNVITDNLHKVRHKGQETKIDQFPLCNILPKDLSIYYTYAGSLTSPPCNECVTWVILSETTHISRRQMNKFRELYASEDDTGEMLVDNFRPVQKICRRKVKICMPLLSEAGYQ